LPKATTNLGTVNGVETAVHTEDGTGKFHVTKKQDVQATLDYTKFLREQPVDRKAEDRHIAEIPPVLAARLIRDGILGDSKRLLKWLDMPENKCFKTVEGRLA
jgi:hypothetical protein